MKHPAEASDLRRYKRALGLAMEALQFYGNPATYHAIFFVADDPAGEFMNDIGKHDDEFYNRRMPGHQARRTLKVIHDRYGDLGVIMRDRYGLAEVSPESEPGKTGQ